MATVNVGNIAYARNPQQIADMGKKPVIEDNDLRNQQLGDRSRRRKKKTPSILGDALASYQAAIQTLLGA